MERTPRVHFVLGDLKSKYALQPARVELSMAYRIDKPLYVTKSRQRPLGPTLAHVGYPHILADMKYP